MLRRCVWKEGEGSGTGSSDAGHRVVVVWRDLDPCAVLVPR